MRAYEDIILDVRALIARKTALLKSLSQLYAKALECLDKGDVEAFAIQIDGQDEIAAGMEAIDLRISETVDGDGYLYADMIDMLTRPYERHLGCPPELCPLADDLSGLHALLKRCKAMSERLARRCDDMRRAKEKDGSA